MKILKMLLATAIASFLMVGCGASNSTIANPNLKGIDISKENIKISSQAAYAKGSHISYAIKTECSIPTQISTYIKEYGESNDLNITIDDAPSKSDMVLKVTIDDAVSGGNGFLGHHKYVAITGKLYKGEKLLSTVYAARKSGGGFMGIFKGSCSVLGRSSKALGKDIARWLKNPIDDAYLGNSGLIRLRNYNR